MALGFAALSLVVTASACADDPVEGTGNERATWVVQSSLPSPDSSITEPIVTPVTGSVSAPAQAAPPPPRPSGPLLGATQLYTPIYAEPSFSQERVGYMRQGGKALAKGEPIKKGACKEGWLELYDGGFVCGRAATLDLEQPRVRLGVRQPDLTATVPYKYAYNRHHGTPLYKSLPSREEMNRIEPYLKEEAEKKKQKKAAEAAEAAPSASAEKGAKHPVPENLPPEGNVPSSDADAKAAVEAIATADSAAPGEPPPEKPWWQSNEGKPSVTLSDLEKDSGGSLSKRMVRGFFVAVDKTLSWNGRTFYRTTGGLIAPADRMWINKAPETKGIDWPSEAKSVFFVLSEKAKRYELSKDGKKMIERGKLARFEAMGLTEKTLEQDGTLYLETLDGTWVKKANGTQTQIEKRPSDVLETEAWVDVDLESKTIVLMKGDQPVFAALIAPGKRSANKQKDHSTPVGAWRIREKHVAVTMDGDGASGDLPYSIEDVPYVAYFKGSYALHAAFWHNNFGREMSHGCVNLAPRDAKTIFDALLPKVHPGWHGAFSTKEHPGSMVVIHQ